jgi:hypothetical protein
MYYGFHLSLLDAACSCLHLRRVGEWNGGRERLWDKRKAESGKGGEKGGGGRILKRCQSPSAAYSRAGTTICTTRLSSVRPRVRASRAAGMLAS